MGNNRCAAICNGKADEKEVGQFTMSEIMLLCHLCKLEIKQSEYTSHIDYVHLACIQETKSVIYTMCLLCGEHSENLETHGKHLIHRHSYFQCPKEYEAKNYLQGKKVKKTMVELASMPEAKWLNKLANGNNLIQYQASQYELITTVKEVDAIDYDQETMKQQMVWATVLKAYRKRAKYYCLESKPYGRNIKVTANILAK